MIEEYFIYLSRIHLDLESIIQYLYMIHYMLSDHVVLRYLNYKETILNPDFINRLLHNNPEFNPNI